MNLIDIIRKQVLVLDGAMGTQIQARTIPAAAWQGKEGCNEWLNLTAPDVIRSIHQAYFEAGSDAVETNSFGGSPLTLGEYDLSDKAFEINRAAAHGYQTGSRSTALRFDDIVWMGFGKSRLQFLHIRIIRDIDKRIA